MSRRSIAAAVIIIAVLAVAAAAVSLFQAGGVQRENENPQTLEDN